jgi:hypothetical protein
LAPLLVGAVCGQRQADMADTCRRLVASSRRASGSRLASPSSSVTGDVSVSDIVHSRCPFARDSFCVSMTHGHGKPRIPTGAWSPSRYASSLRFLTVWGRLLRGGGREVPAAPRNPYSPSDPVAAKAIVPRRVML